MREEWLRSDHTLREDPPAWAGEVFSEAQLGALTWTKLWQKAIAAAALSRTTKGVAWALSLYFSGNQDDEASPSTDGLAADASVSRTTVVKALDELDAVGLIDRERGGGRLPGSSRGRRTRYWLSFPAALELSSSRTVQPLNGKPGADTVQPTGLTVQPSTSNCSGAEREGVLEGTLGRDSLEGAALADASVGLEDALRQQGAAFGRWVKSGVLDHEDAEAAVSRVSREEDRREFMVGYAIGFAEEGAA